MLVAGEIDALYTARLPPSFLRGDPRVRRLFPDYKAAERAYFRKTGLFPIMHFVVVREDVYREHRWVAESLYKAFCAAKEQGLRSLFEPNVLACSLPWLVPEVERISKPLAK